MAAITPNHMPVLGKATSGLSISVWCQDSKAFLQAMSPSWDLSVVLEGLLKAPFKPMVSASKVTDPKKFLTHMQALSVTPSGLKLTPGMVKAILHSCKCGFTSGC